MIRQHHIIICDKHGETHYWNALAHDQWPKYTLGGRCCACAKEIFNNPDYDIEKVYEDGKLLGYCWYYQENPEIDEALDSATYPVVIDDPVFSEKVKAMGFT